MKNTLLKAFNQGGKITQLNQARLPLHDGVRTLGQICKKPAPKTYAFKGKATIEVKVTMLE